MRIATIFALLPVVLGLLLLGPGQGAAAGVDKRIASYFDCIDRYAGPAIKKLAAARGNLTDMEITGEVTKAEARCQKQVSAAILAVREAPKNGTQDMTDDQIHAQLRTMSAAGYVMTYGQQ